MSESYGLKSLGKESLPRRVLLGTIRGPDYQALLGPSRVRRRLRVCLMENIGLQAHAAQVA